MPTLGGRTLGFKLQASNLHLLYVVRFFERGRRRSDVQHGAIGCDGCIRCSAPHYVTFYFIPNYCSPEVEEEHKERGEKKGEEEIYAL